MRTDTSKKLLWEVCGCNVMELMAVLIAREVRDHEVSASGAMSMLPAAGLLLGQALHAPNAQLIVLGTPLMPFDTSRQFHYLAQRGDLGLFFVSGIQIDQHGNYNLHQLGEDHQAPTLRMPGGYGGGMIYYGAKRTIIFRTEHSPRTFVPRVDYISAAGTTPTDVLRHGNPSKVITPMAVLGFDVESGQMFLETPNPPYSAEEVAEQTGFSLGSLNVKPTLPPTEHELATLRGAVRKRMIAERIYPDWAENNLQISN